MTESYGDIKPIHIKWDELFAIVNMLNEVCNGIHINKFSKTIGCSFSTANSLLKKLGAFKSPIGKETEIIDVYLTDQDIAVIKNAYSEVRKQIDDWEFPIRIGVSIEEAQKILKQFF